MPIDMPQEFDRLNAFYDATAALLDTPGDVLFGVNETVSGWSPAQHLYHVWLASGKSLAAALYIARAGVKPTELPTRPGARCSRRSASPASRWTRRTRCARRTISTAPR